MSEKVLQERIKECAAGIAYYFEEFPKYRDHEHVEEKITALVSGLAAENANLRAALEEARQVARSEYERGLECVEMKCSYCGERIAWPKNEANPHCIPRCSKGPEEKP